MPTLSELAKLYGTDKFHHGYMDFYQEHLPTSPKRILEIGVKEGRSIQMWKHFFPESELHGLDLFIEFPVPPIPGVTWHKGNQCDWRMLEQLRTLDFDVIIDDGSHNSRDQMITFFGLYNGKHYFIEDLHCCDQEFYRDKLPFDYTASGLFNGLLSVVRKNKIIDGKKIILIHD